MSRQDIETMQAAYDAFNRGDIPTVMEVMHPEVRWVEPGGGGSPAGTFTGPESVANDVFAAIPGNFEQFRADAEEWIDAVDRLAVVGHFHGSSKSGGAVDVPFVHIWTMRQGKAATFENLVDHGLWTQAWGG